MGLNPNDAVHYNNRGLTKRDLGQYEKAIEDYNRAIELDPNCAEARFNLALLLASSRDPKYDEARAQYEAALRLGGPRDSRLDQILYP